MGELRSGMKKVRFLSLLLFLELCCVPMQAHAQDFDLNFLFNQWAISFPESSDDIAIVRNPKSEHFLNRKDVSSVYDFTIGMDSIIFQKKMINRESWCGTFGERDILGEEIWTLDFENKKLRNDIYFESSENQDHANYSAIYSIQVLQSDYMKLRLEKELFEGELLDD